MEWIIGAQREEKVAGYGVDYFGSREEKSGRIWSGLLWLKRGKKWQDMEWIIVAQERKRWQDMEWIIVAQERKRWQDMEWIIVAQDRKSVQAVVNAVMKLLVSKNVENVWPAEELLASQKDCNA